MDDHSSTTDPRWTDQLLCQCFVDPRTFSPLTSVALGSSSRVLARWGVVAVLFIIELAARNDGSALVSLNSIASIVVLVIFANAPAILSFDFKRLSRPLFTVSDFIQSMVWFVREWHQGLS